MGLLYHTIRDIPSKSSKHLLPDSYRFVWSLIADAISDGWPKNKTLDAGRPHPKETASAAFRDCECEMVIPDLRHFPSHHQFNQCCLIGSSNRQDLVHHVLKGTDLFFSLQSSTTDSSRMLMVATTIDQLFHLAPQKHDQYCIAIFDRLLNGFARTAYV